MFLLLITKAMALAATVNPAPRGVAEAVRAVKRDRQVLRFFTHHAWLLRDPSFGPEARHQVAAHRSSLAAAQRVIAAAHLRRSQGVARAIRKAKLDRRALRFFARHAWLLADPRFSVEAKRQVALHRRSLAAAEGVIARAHGQVRSGQVGRTLAQATAESPAVTICRVFGRYCDEALRVASCESGIRTGAQNGQYLGLFQMGSQARRLFGHGSSAETQARAAHRYFVASGRDWSPWSCRPR